MNKIIGGLIALALALAAGLAVWLLPLADEGGPGSAVVPAPEKVAAENPPAAEIQSSADGNAGANDESEAGTVAGVGQLRDFNCSMTKHMVHLGDGLVTEAYSCDPPDVEDPFAAYSDADLLVMSYSDAGAAEELGRRLLFQNEEGPANEMMLRAVALRPDDISPLQYLVSHTGSLRGPSREARRQVGNAYIISKTASHFDPTISTSWLKDELAEHQFTAEDIEFMDRLVEGNLERMRAVQVEVFGESRIGEAL